MARPRIWLYDNSEGVYVDKSNVTSFTFDDKDDVLYIGYTNRFSTIIPTLSTLGSYSGFEIAYCKDIHEDSQTWEDTELTWALDSSYITNWSPIARDWDRAAFNTTYPHTAEPIDTKERFWLRLTCTAVTTAAVITNIEVIEYAYYCSASNVTDYLQFMGVSTSTKPQEIVVEDMIHRAESDIDWFTKRTWRPQTIVNEIHNSENQCIRLYHYPISSVISASRYNGNSWQTLTEGRDGDFYVDSEKGLLYLTHNFRPYVFFFYPYYFDQTSRSDFRITYVWGKKLSDDPQRAGLVEDIALKKTCVDVLRSHDFTVIIKGGVDRLSVYDKVRELTYESDAKLERLARLVME